MPGFKSQLCHRLGVILASSLSGLSFYISKMGILTVPTQQYGCRRN